MPEFKNLTVILLQSDIAWLAEEEQNSIFAHCLHSNHMESRYNMVVH